MGTERERQVAYACTVVGCASQQPPRLVCQTVVHQRELAVLVKPVQAPCYARLGAACLTCVLEQPAESAPSVQSYRMRLTQAAA